MNGLTAAKRHFLLGAAVASVVALIALNGMLLWKMKTSVPFSVALDLTRQNQGTAIELGGLFPGPYHLAIEFSLPSDFKETGNFYRGIGAKRIHEDLGVDLELVLEDGSGRSLLETDTSTREGKIYSNPHLEHTDGGLQRFSFEANLFRSYDLRTAVLRENLAAEPYHASLLIYADGIEYLGIKTAIYNSLLVIALIVTIVLIWAQRFGEIDEDVPTLPSS